MTNPLREYQQLKQQLAATDGIIVALRQLTRMHELLQQFDSTLELGEYQRASVALREIVCTLCVCALLRRLDFF